MKRKNGPKKADAMLIAKMNTRYYIIQSFQTIRKVYHQVNIRMCFTMFGGDNNK